ncbi:hypothetical protein [Burkholderia vietnamiensis]|uniref:hypothetical protein n=1 Tax=Burkholderia vietnamiensis TaxID=60552 RepID=UPI001CB0A62B|nr:hypothetical protein [Burkholderia vietnamiensis]CAG9228893.1 conserved hypothetical protein [Burkholderia vietnamiensis]HDR9086354.1 hypothetical protein [Burkholderia vietnamiensis]
MTTYATMPFCDQQDSSKFQQKKENPALASKMDGGYVVTRPRHTRPPRRTFTTGFTSVDEATKEAFDAFFDSVHGGSVIFIFIHPTTKEQVPVRFTTDTELNWKYSGAGTNFRWDVDFKLEEV